MALTKVTSDLVTSTGASNGDVLTADGSGGSSWAAAGGGDKVFIGEVSGTGLTAADFINGVSGIVLDGTYSTYEFDILYWYPSTSGAQLWARTRTGGTFDAGGLDYEFAYDGTQYITAIHSGSLTSTRITMAFDVKNTSGEALAGKAILRNITDGSRFTSLTHHVGWFDASADEPVNLTGTGYRRTGTTVDGLRFTTNTGTFSTKIRLYGIT